jgi:hypothetical protein
VQGERKDRAWFISWFSTEMTPQGRIGSGQPPGFGGDRQTCLASIIIAPERRVPDFGKGV